MRGILVLLLFIKHDLAGKKFSKYLALTKYQG